MAQSLGLQWLLLQRMIIKGQMQGQSNISSHTISERSWDVFAIEN